MAIDAETTVAGITRLYAGTLLALLCLQLSCAGFLTVNMAEKTQVLLNDNATIPCNICSSRRLNVSIMGVTWFRKNQVDGTEDMVFQFIGGFSKAHRSGANMSLQRLKMGDASLQLRGVQLRDAALYRCEVVLTPNKAQGTGHLEVVANPVISHSMEDHDQRILCKSTNYYPEDIKITWYKQTQGNPQFPELTEGITTGPAIKNEDGTFNVTSYLQRNLSLEYNVKAYECEVRTPTFSKRMNITLLKKGPETESGLGSLIHHDWWIIGVICIGLPVIIRPAVIILKKWYGVGANKVYEPYTLKLAVGVQGSSLEDVLKSSQD